MKITKPEEKQTISNDHLLNVLIDTFENKLKQEENDQEYYHLVIKGEYPRIILNQVEQKYTHAGWSKVICKTSSENRERPGLTGLQLWRNEK